MNNLVMRFLFFLIPIPLFFDLSSGSFVLEDTAFSYSVGIPIPLGGISLSLIFVLFFFIRILGGKGIQSTLDESTRNFVVIFVFWIISIFIFTTSGLTFVRVVQLALPLIFLTFFSIYTDQEKLNKILISGFWGGGLFFTLHLISIVFYGPFDIQDVPNYSDRDFPLFFGISIYQSLVSYPAVLSIFFTLSLFLYRYKPISSLLIMSVTASLLMLGARRASFFEFILILFMLVLLVGRKVSFKGLISKCILLFSFCISFSFSPLLHRLIERIDNNTFSGGRAAIYEKAVDVLTADFFNFLFGFGDSSKVGFHNFILDTIYRIGFLGVSVYMFFCAFLFFLFLRMSKKINYRNKIFILILLCQFLLQLMVNSPLTQLYYLSSFIFGLTFVIFYSEDVIRETNIARHG